MRILDSLTTAALCVSLLGGQGPLVAQEAENSLAASSAASSEAESALATKLAAPAELAFQDTPLSELPNWLRVHHGVQAILEVKALEDAGVERDTPVTLKLRGVSLRSALRHLLRQQDLTWRVDGELLIVTTPEEAEQHERAVVYPVLDLVQGEGEDGEETGLDYDTLLDLIVTSVAPDSWDEGNSHPNFIVGGALVIPQSEHALEQIAGLLAAFRRARDEAKSDTSTVGRPIYVEPLGNSRIRDSLATPTDLEFAVTPLGKAVDQLARAYEIPVLLDTKALEEAGVPVDSPLSMARKGLPLRLALRHALAPLELVVAVRDEALLITTPEEAEQSCISIGVYPVGDLVEVSNDGKADPESLVNAVHAVASESWSRVGGPGSASYFPPSRALVIAQVDDVHDEITKFLEDYRAAQAKLPPATPRKEPADDEMSIRFYRLFPGNEALTAQQVGELLQVFVAPASWNADKDVSLRAAGHLLIVRQRHAVHREIEQFLRKLGATPQGMGGGPGRGMFHVPHKTPAAPTTVKDGAAS